jgi:hypothetical protein
LQSFGQTIISVRNITHNTSKKDHNLAHITLIRKAGGEKAGASTRVLGGIQPEMHHGNGTGGKRPHEQAFNAAGHNPYCPPSDVDPWHKVRNVLESCEKDTDLRYSKLRAENETIKTVYQREWATYNQLTRVWAAKLSEADATIRKSEKKIQEGEELKEALLADKDVVQKKLDSLRVVAQQQIDQLTGQRIALQEEVKSGEERVLKLLLQKEHELKELHA